jgi:hypothetical protein
MRESLFVFLFSNHPSFMRTILSFFLFALALTSFAQKPISGSLTCTLNGKPWKGEVQSAIYSKQQDYLLVGFEDNASRMEVTVRHVKAEISKEIPYTDEIQGEFKAGYDRDLIFFVRYFPDKKKAGNYETAYSLLRGGFSVDALDLTQLTAQLAFQITCGRATSSFNPMKPDEKDLEKLEIKNAESTPIKFLAF